MRKSGNIFFGVFTIVFGLIFCLLGGLSFNLSKILFYIFIGVGGVLIIVGLYQSVNYLLDRKTLEKGTCGFAKVVKIFDNKSTDSVKKVTEIFRVEYEYVGKNGKTYRYTANVPLSLIEKISPEKQLAVKIYKSRAVIDLKRL